MFKTWGAWNTPIYCSAKAYPHTRPILVQSAGAVKLNVSISLIKLVDTSEAPILKT